jgi:hypothetical protein
MAARALASVAAKSDALVIAEPASAAWVAVPPTTAATKEVRKIILGMTILFGMTSVDPAIEPSGRGEPYDADVDNRQEHTE